MSRARYCRICGDWHDLEAPWPDNCRPEPIWAASDLPRPQLIRDGLDDVWNPVDGKRYSSKQAYYKAVRASGNEIAGNDKSITEYHERIKDKKPKAAPGLKDDLKRAWETHT